METRLLGKPSDFSGAQDAWRDWSTVFREYTGIAVPRLQKLMVQAAKAGAPIPNAAILQEDDRAALAQLYRMMLMICARESYFDLGIGSEGIPESRGAGEEICSVGVPRVREGAFR